MPYDALNDFLCFENQVITANSVLAVQNTVKQGREKAGGEILILLTLSHCFLHIEVTSNKKSARSDKN